ncbi:MAG: hypothetical protein K0U74_08350 [Alphaproteobacteria bacterium]|nr:hypothetical protein [Alphaproteobacteria bacterium]
MKTLLGKSAVGIGGSLLLAAGSMSAQAADFGGDCCADLEERVAELEATTARKGNRKVSLTISGLINEEVMYFDDGFEQNLYQVTNGSISSRFRFKGTAKINAEWSAGFYIELEMFGADSITANQANDDGALGGQVRLRQANWHLKSKRLGTLTVGQGSPATDDIILAHTGGCYPACFSDVGLNGGGINPRVVGTGATLPVRILGFTQGSLDTDRANIVRYDTPVFAGAKLVVAAGEDDFWDVALWWAGKFGDFKAKAQVGYLEDTDRNGGHIVAAQSVLGSPNPNAYDLQEVKGSASIIHSPTGLFLGGAFVHREFDGDLNTAPFTQRDFNYWYVRAGILAKVFSIGKTSVYGEYSHADDAFGVNFGGIQVTSSELDTYGAGIVQHIDAAAMNLYLSYKHFDSELNVVGVGVPLEEIDIVTFGAMIKF